MRTLILTAVAAVVLAGCTGNTPSTPAPPPSSAPANTVVTLFSKKIGE